MFEYFKWSIDNNRFEFSDDAHISGDLYVEGSGTFEQGINITPQGGDGYIFFDAGSQYLKWDDGNNRFEFSDDLYFAVGAAQGTIRSQGGWSLAADNGYIDIYTSAGQAIYFQCGGLFYWRDIDAGKAVRMSLDSSSGNLWINGDFTTDGSIEAEGKLFAGNSVLNKLRIPYIKAERIDVGVDNLYSLSFDGTNSYVNFGNIFNRDDDFTMECWFRIDVLPSNAGRRYAIIAKGAAGGSDFNIFLKDNDNKIIFYFSSVGGDYNITSNAAVIIDTWYHVAIVWEKGVELAMYVDGVKQAITANPVGNRETNAVDLLIGESEEWSGFHDGFIDEVRLWNCIRTQPQIDDNKSEFIDPDTTDLAYYWRFEENYGSVVHSLTSTEANGSLEGNTAFSTTVPFAGGGNLNVAGDLYVNSDLYFANNSKIHIPGFLVGPFPWEIWSAGNTMYFGKDSVAHITLDGSTGDTICIKHLKVGYGLTINKDAEDMNYAITFNKPTSGEETLIWDKTDERFEFSDDLYVNGDFYANSANGKGVIVKDKTTGNLFRIIVDNGAVTCEAV